jgi:hypothetical protein
MMATSAELIEAEIVFGKSTLCENIVHVPQAIVEGLEDEMKWQYGEEVRVMCSLPWIVSWWCCRRCEGVPGGKILGPVKERRLAVISLYL